MTIQLELPDELERALRRRAERSGREINSLLVGLLQESVTKSDDSLLPLLPGEYPYEEPGEELDYQPVEFPIVGTVQVRFVDGGPLLPQAYPDDE
jgi:hypothetical protein